ncbi:hypothetical protein MCOR15_011186 [Pyricularia oryzae]|nr:hypothetical protein MCOR15_011186 [Pyricularia oryzae]
MTDPDIILYLYPIDGLGNKGASYAISLPENKSRFVPAAASSSNNVHRSRQDRDATEEPEERGRFNGDPCIVLRFSQGARSRLGVVTGRAPDVDFVLPKLPGVSRFHLSFTFDDQNRPIVRDLGSLWGTKVTYDGEKGECRSKFDWLLQAPGSVRNEGKLPVLEVTPHIQFRVFVPRRDFTSQDHIDRVTAFRQGTADPGGMLASLVLHSGSRTTLPSGTQTPAHPSGTILYKRFLGNGVFGVVSYIWNVTTGEEYAVKEPLLEVIRSGQVIMKDWKKEANMMGALSHLLSALRYLHSREPPISHRDIKPQNILVQYHRPNEIHVKFADFGLAKAAYDLKTFCGTRLWMAPEVYSRGDPYSVAVDLWSLGVVVASKECKLPKQKPAYKSSPVDWSRAEIGADRKHPARVYP